MAKQTPAVMVILAVSILGALRVYQRGPQQGPEAGLAKVFLQGPPQNPVGFCTPFMLQPLYTGTPTQPPSLELRLTIGGQGVGFFLNPECTRAANAPVQLPKDGFFTVYLKPDRVGELQGTFKRESDSAEQPIEFSDPLAFVASSPEAKNQKRTEFRMVNGKTWSLVAQRFDLEVVALDGDGRVLQSLSQSVHLVVRSKEGGADVTSEAVPGTPEQSYAHGKISFKGVSFKRSGVYTIFVREGDRETPVTDVTVEAGKIAIEFNGELWAAENRGENVYYLPKNHVEKKIVPTSNKNEFLMDGEKIELLSQTPEKMVVVSKNYVRVNLDGNVMRTIRLGPSRFQLLGSSEVHEVTFDSSTSRWVIQGKSYRVVSSNPHEIVLKSK